MKVLQKKNMKNSVKNLKVLKRRKLNRGRDVKTCRDDKSDLNFYYKTLKFKLLCIKARTRNIEININTY